MPVYRTVAKSEYDEESAGIETGSERLSRDVVLTKES
jgi:hypothetical protein